MLQRRLSVIALFLLCSFATRAGVDFKREVRPLMTEYCLGCHSTAKHKGDLDLEQFASLDEVKRHPKIWQNVIEQVGSGEMPPKEKPQPNPKDREKLLKFAHSALDQVARASAGDPGPVVLRRLSNAEYTYTIRDLTGVESLDPAKEFPVDGAAGEGFMNVGNALVMSPALFSKYLDAAKKISEHAVLLPDGIRFSPGVSRRDWTDELLREIRAFYSQFTDPHGGDKVNLQGIVFETNEGGRIPLEKYLAATLDLPSYEKARRRALEDRARTNGLNFQYLKHLADRLSSSDRSLLLDQIRAAGWGSNRERITNVVADIQKWQKAVWKFNPVGQLARPGGPTTWLEAVTPIVEKQEIRFKIAAPKEGDSVYLDLEVGDAGDGRTNDLAVWRQPRFVSAGRPDLLLRDVRSVSGTLIARREKIFSDTTKYLSAAAEASTMGSKIDLKALAEKFQVEEDALGAWLDFLGLGAGDAAKIDSYLTNTIKNASSYDFVQGWGSPDTPLFLANSSDQTVRIPGVMKGHSVTVHPSPTLQVAVGWRSPVAAKGRIEARIQQAHPECGNGVTWSLELRRGSTRRRLAAGIAEGGKESKPAPIENMNLRAGDLISILVGPRDGNHSCDLTAVDLVIKTDEREWNLAADVSANILAGNPHADRFGNEGVWHFYTEPDKGGNGAAPVIPAASLLAKWEAATDKAELANALQKLLTSPAPGDAKNPDGELYSQMHSLGGPFFAGLLKAAIQKPDPNATSKWGMNPARFQNGDFHVAAQGGEASYLPAELVAGAEFVTTGELEADGSVQFYAGTSRFELNSMADPSVAIVSHTNSPARKRIEAAMNDFRDLFPAALCYSKIVPVDEVITLTLFHREDDQLRRLMLNDEQARKLDRMWDELRFISQDSLLLVDALEQLKQYATQDRNDLVAGFDALRKPFLDRAAAFKQRTIEAEPTQLEAALKFAEKAYRRPIKAEEQAGLRELYAKLRKEEIPHEEALRLTLARVLVSPAFLYHGEEPGAGAKPTRINDWELANRLSYFLWSSPPDAELKKAAMDGKLHEPRTLEAQTRRMLGDPKMRRMAKEFATAWLHIYDFDDLSEKSERHFPTFLQLRSDMYEESIRYFADLFENDGSVLSIVDSDHTFLNEALAKHYGIPNVNGADWRRVDGVKKYSRGGILAQATVLAKESGASRTSPILRGNWLSETLLGEKLPRPPKDVPRLPEDEATETLTVRQLTEKHSTDPRCAGCHARIDAFGFSLEEFDAIGRLRDRDLGGRAIDTHAKTLDGAQFEGVDGLRQYLLTKRRDAFVTQFCRKLLGYSLGRAVQLSDGPLIEEMRDKLKSKKYRVSAAINVIVQSRQFREIRGRETASDE